MNKEQVVGLAVRLFAVLLVVYTLRNATGLIGYPTSEISDIRAVLIFLIVFSPLLIAFLLWQFPLTIASKLIPLAKKSKKSFIASAHETHAMVFSAVGLWLLTSAIPNAFYLGSLHYYLNRLGTGFKELTPDNFAGIVSVSIQIVLGVWLLFGSRGIVGLIRKVRYSGS